MKTLIFYAKAGGGHESAAKTLLRELQKNPDSEVKMVDIFSTSPAFIQWIFNQGYVLITTKFIWLWKISCYLWTFKPFFLANFWLVKKLSKAPNLIQTELKEFSPDVILTTYFAIDLWIFQELTKKNPLLRGGGKGVCLLRCSRGGCLLKRVRNIFPLKKGREGITNFGQDKEDRVCFTESEGFYYKQNNNKSKTSKIDLVQDKSKLKPKVYAILVDIFNPHPVWFNGSPVDYIAFSQEAKNIALKSGVSKQKIQQFKPFFNTQFETELNLEAKQKFAQELSLDLNLPTVLITGGGSGLPNTLEILKQLKKKAKIKINVLVVAGRNVGLEKEIQNFIQNSKNSNLKIYPFGFTSKMYELTNLADVVISKAGPASIFEVLALNKPLILAHYIWPQELGNLKFIEKNKFGLYLTNSRQIVDKILELVANPDKLEKLKQHIKAYNFQAGTADLAQFLIQKNS